jgi:hypothetical protein
VVISRLVLLLAISAIATTIIGSFLAMSQFYGDIIASTQKNSGSSGAASSGSSGSGGSGSTSSSSSRVQLNKILPRLLTVLPPTIVSALGSQSLYYAATAFAGAFPVCTLWCLFPPLTRVILGRRRRQQGASPLPLLSGINIKDMLMIVASGALLLVNLSLGLFAQLR